MKQHNISGITIKRGIPKEKGRLIVKGRKQLFDPNGRLTLLGDYIEPNNPFVFGGVEMVWKVKGIGEPVQQVWEDFYGDLWFVTEIDSGQGDSFGYARLRSMPDMAEWGYFNIEYLKKEIGEHKIWQVPIENWGNVNSYEDGLLVEVEE